VNSEGKRQRLGCLKTSAVLRACISINSLRAKCPAAGRGMQVLSFQGYCTPPVGRTGRRPAV